jgi:hypothetical protein
MAVVADLGADIQPAGWRLTSARGVDQRRARSLLAQDLDALEAQAQGLTGRLKIQVAGPWTLAATVERPRGDRVLADHGARRELASALAEGLREHIADVASRVPGAALDVQVDEPALPAVLAGRVPTASGFSRHRSVDPPVASAALEEVLTAVREAGATPLAHCCAEDAPLALLAGAGAEGLCVDLSVLRREEYDDVAAMLDGGRRVFLGVVPTVEGPGTVTERTVTERVLRLLDELGLDSEDVRARLVVTPGCGLAEAGSWARPALELCARVARNLSSS